MWLKFAICSYFTGKVENFHLQFFQLQFFFLPKRFSVVIFHSPVAFQGYKIYQILVNVQTFIMAWKIMQWIENRTLESFRNNFKQVVLKRKATYLVKSSIKHSGKKNTSMNFSVWNPLWHVSNFKSHWKLTNSVCISSL